MSICIINGKSLPNLSTTNITITTKPNTQTIVEAVNTAYSLAYRKYETFQNWCHAEKNPLPAVESLIYAGFFYTDIETSKAVVLETNLPTNDIIIEISSLIVVQLKPHQIDGVKYLWNQVFKSTSQIKASIANESQFGQSGSGAILAHCPDLIICNEGHIIKNPRSAITYILNKVRTHRCIALTGTPMRNNLKEYFAMVNFCKAHFLGQFNYFVELNQN
ncbi:unnamed protein product [Rotaria sp. Silwood2]|nr:unnamed protein product [Rotaria sp. Silwood2]